MISMQLLNTKIVGPHPVLISITLFSGMDPVENGVPGEIRTHDPRIRNPVLYPAELRGLIGSFYPSQQLL